MFYLLFPPLVMATTPMVERHVHHDTADSSAASVVLVVIAALLILGFFLFAFNLLPFGTATPAATDNGASINVDADFPPVTPGTPDGQ